MSIFLPVIFGLVVTFVLEVFLATTLNNILFAYPVLCPVLSHLLCLFLASSYFFFLFSWLNCPSHLCHCHQLGAMKRGEPDLTFTLRMKHTRDGFHGGSESDESSTPRKIRRTNIFNRMMMDSPAISSDGHNNYGGERSPSSGDEATTNISRFSPATPPIFNHHNARRRKGIPHRAPFWDESIIYVVWSYSYMVNWSDRLYKKTNR